MTTFQSIYARAAARKGGPEALESLLPAVASAERLASTPDSVLLSLAAKRVFAAGFVWRVVENKWPAFTEPFRDWLPMGVAMLSDFDVDALSQDPRIIRHRGKIEAVRANARMMVEVAEEHGSFARFLADWPSSDLVGLLEWLKTHGSRLGGNTGSYFLRTAGKDAFILTSDVAEALVAAGVVDKAPTGKRAKRAVQEQFNAWAEESGRSYAEMSKVLACSVPGRRG